MPVVAGEDFVKRVSPEGWDGGAKGVEEGAAATVALRSAANKPKIWRNLQMEIGSWETCFGVIVDSGVTEWYVRTRTAIRAGGGNRAFGLGFRRQVYG
ncbi:hypothetical protein VDG1235_2657 [Verrucomicrobiia bacterium DG1235]|nr:hypothetical protein VDG1235_2657 [Verrucomicrobiae bacterium DG1235]